MLLTQLLIGLNISRVVNQANVYMSDNCLSLNIFIARDLTLILRCQNVTICMK